MIFRSLVRITLLLPLVLAACGDLPEPFLGNPGVMGRRLAAPTTPMLAVPPPPKALLGAQASADFADLLALSLQRDEVPTLAREPQKLDWRLAVTAERRGDDVVPRYAIQDPSGHEQGAIDGGHVAASGWTAGADKILGQAAQDAVPKIVALMMSIRATRDRADPNSLLHRVAKLYVPDVTGAPGDGNIALTKQIRAKLAEFGPLVQLTPDGTDFYVKGTVVMSPLPKGQQQVEIAWTVTRPSGVVTGKVSQLNAIVAGSLNQYWGDVAVVVAQEAASGVDRVVERFINRDGTDIGQDASAGKTAGPATPPVPPPLPAAALGGSSVQGKAAVPDAGNGPVKTAAPGKPVGPGPGVASAHGAGKATAAGKAARGDDLGALIKQLDHKHRGRPVPAEGIGQGAGAVPADAAAPAKPPAQ
jgi:hypothetical protein